MEGRQPTILDYLYELDRVFLQQQELWEDFMNSKVGWGEFFEAEPMLKRKAMEIRDELEGYVRLQRITR